MATRLFKLGPGNVVDEVPWSPMEAMDHATMAVEGLLISFLADHGFDSTPVCEERKAIAQRMAAYAIMTYSNFVSHEVENIAFPPKPMLKKTKDTK